MDFDAKTILAFVAGGNNDVRAETKPAGPAAEAAIKLAKISQGLPAVLFADVAAKDAFASEHHRQGEGGVGRPLSRRVYPVLDDCQQSIRAAEIRRARDLCRISQWDRRESGRYNHRPAQGKKNK